MVPQSLSWDLFGSCQSTATGSPVWGNRPAGLRIFRFSGVTIHTPWTDVKCNVPTHDGSVTGAEN